MKYIISTLFFLHGAIHMMGFARGLGGMHIDGFYADISRGAAWLWLLAFLLLLVSGAGYFRDARFWVFTAVAGIALSSLLIVSVWSDARFGMLPNIILLVTVLAALSSCSMKRMIATETDEILGRAQNNARVISEEHISHLPVPVARWLQSCGMINRPEIHNVWVRQRALMKMKPEQKDWHTAMAEQHVVTHEPAFLWTVELSMSPLIKIKGRDKYLDGRGEMLIKMNSLINVVNEKGPRMDEGTLQRFLGELVWYPSFALSPYITWEAIDEFSARAVMTYGGVSGSGVFTFDEDGNFIKFEALRYMGNKEDVKKYPWIITVDDYAVFDGIKVPSRMQAAWLMDDGEWTWLKLVIEDLRYNI